MNKFLDTNENKQLYKIIKEIASDEGYEYRTFSDGWVIQLKKDSKVQYIYGFQFQNNNACVEKICGDKSAMFTVLNSENIPAISECSVPVLRSHL